MLFLFACAAAIAQTFDVTPPLIRQGETLSVKADKTVASARLQNKTVKLFVQPDGASLGLMPVPVLLKPGQYTIEFLDSAGHVVHSSQIDVRDAHYPKQNVVLTKALSELRSTPEERQTVTAFLETVSPVRYWIEPLQAPLPGCMTSLFGVQRYHNGKPTGDFHAGVDQRGAAGTPIRAIAAGEVKIVQPFQLRGNTVAIDHGQGLQSIYLHMSKFIAKPGDHVEAGDVIGLVGSTGRSTGPHLHWSIYANGEPVNPQQWVSLSPCASSTRPKPLKRRIPNSKP